MPTKKNNPNINTNTVSIGGRNYLTQLKPGSKNPRVLDILPDQPISPRKFIATGMLSKTVASFRALRHLRISAPHQSTQKMSPTYYLYLYVPTMTSGP